MRHQLLDQLASHVQEACAPGREEPLLSAARQEVDVTGPDVVGGGTHTLNGIDKEVDVAFTTGSAKCLKVELEPRLERHPGNRKHPHAGFAECADKRVVL